MAFDLEGKALKNLRLSCVDTGAARIELVTAQENDNHTRYVTLSLYDDRGTVDLTPYTAATFNAVLPDGTRQTAPAEIAPSAGYVLCEVVGSMLARPGTLSCDVLLVGRDNRGNPLTLTSPTFYVTVRPSCTGGDATGAEPYTSVFADLVLRMEETEHSVGGKVDKTSTGNILYGTKQNAYDTVTEEACIPYTSGARAGSVAWRDGAGNLSVGTPTLSTHAVPRSYVDAQTSALQADIGSLRTFQQSLEKRIEDVETAGKLIKDTRLSGGKAQLAVPGEVYPYASVDALYATEPKKRYLNLLPHENYVSLPNGKTTAAHGGLTYTRDPYGRIAVNGTPAGEAGYTEVWLHNSRSGFLPAVGTYTGSGCPAGGGSGRYFLRYLVHSKNGTEIHYWDYGTGVTFSVTGDTDYVSCTLRVYNGVAVNFTVEPQLQAGTEKTAWQPHTGVWQFSSLSCIKSYTAEGELVDTWHVPAALSACPDFGAHCVYNVMMDETQSTYVSTYGFGNAADIERGIYCHPVVVRDYMAGDGDPNYGITDGIHTAMYPDMEHIRIQGAVPDLYLAVSGGGYLRFESKDGAPPMGVRLTFQKKGRDEA